jgi:hypothetical protein
MFLSPFCLFVCLFFLSLFPKERFLLSTAIWKVKVNCHSHNHFLVWLVPPSLFTAGHNNKSLLKTNKKLEIVLTDWLTDWLSLSAEYRSSFFWKSLSHHCGRERPRKNFLTGACQDNKTFGFLSKSYYIFLAFMQMRVQPQRCITTSWELPEASSPLQHQRFKTLTHMYICAEHNMFSYLIYFLITNLFYKIHFS